MCSSQRPNENSELSTDAAEGQWREGLTIYPRFGCFFGTVCLAVGFVDVAGLDIGFTAAGFFGAGFTATAFFGAALTGAAF